MKRLYRVTYTFLDDSEAIAEGVLEIWAVSSASAEGRTQDIFGAVRPDWKLSIDTIRKVGIVGHAFRALGWEEAWG